MLPGCCPRLSWGSYRSPGGATAPTDPLTVCRPCMQIHLLFSCQPTGENPVFWQNHKSCHNWIFVQITPWLPYLRCLLWCYRRWPGLGLQVGNLFPFLPIFCVLYVVRCVLGAFLFLPLVHGSFFSSADGEATRSEAFRIVWCPCRCRSCHRPQFL